MKRPLISRLLELFDYFLVKPLN
jgi:hypothetical protein